MMIWKRGGERAHRNGRDYSTILEGMLVFCIGWIFENRWEFDGIGDEREGIGGSREGKRCLF